MKCSSESSSKPDRKTVETNRRIQMKSLCFKLASLVPPQHFKTTNSKIFYFVRIQMKSLCFKLASLVPPQHFKTTNSKDTVSQQNQLDIAASYIKQLRERIENLKERKEKAMRSQLGSSNSDIGSIAAENAVMTGSRLPVLEIKDSGSCIEVMLISGLNKNFMFYEVIRVLQEQGAEVVSASFFTVGDKVFHSVHAQVKISRDGVDTSTVWQRLQDLLY